MDRLGPARLTEAMTTSPYVIAATAAAVTSAAVGGLFYAFSTFVMKGLDRTEPAEAITAMRGINAEAQANAPFLALFVGARRCWRSASASWPRCGCRSPAPATCSPAPCSGWWPFVVTMAFNVPLNNRLDAVDPAALSAADALRQWQAYLGAVDGVEPRPDGGAAGGVGADAGRPATHR